MFYNLEARSDNLGSHFVHYTLPNYITVKEADCTIVVNGGKSVNNELFLFFPA